jgi:hypothetical protein
MIALLAVLVLQEAVIATAPADIAPATLSATAAPAVEAQEPGEELTTAQQIERWLARPRDADSADVDLAGPWPEPFDDGRMHGSFSVGVGTGGYSSVAGSVSTPIGERGRLDLHFSRSEGEGYWGWPGDHGPYDPRFRDAWD